ncbi:hypothetical protein CC117_14170 [Parafrankia colletiae]|uniref:Luciferase-like domain-containing protein n=1 Tax=Parafrankia colletiae TaxID=573497 RepID=A0A1S1R297_9ACTN|nr:LLM class flavin-dependent oxidoreductase [Frankia sp. Cpl3]OHV40300.1 hypothetical protein CC117_14170 [Parafrankia colletiae]
MIGTGNRRLHLSLNLNGLGFHRAGWRHPSSQPDRVFSADYYVELARTAERGRLDAIFLADTPAFVLMPGRSVTLQAEPVALLSALAVATTRVGLIGTISASYSEPYTVARQFAMLDHLSGGRAGVNVVTSAGDRVAQNFGRNSHFEHATRYERAADFLTVVTSLWDSWADDTVQADKASGVFADLDTIVEINHISEHFRVRGPLNIPRPPQGRPVLVQAGASTRGRDLAARWADAVYTGSSTVENGQAFYRDVRQRAADAGRSPDSLRILPGLIPYVGSTEREARELRRELEDQPEPLAGMIEELGAVLETDLGGLDPDRPMDLALFPDEATYGQSVSRLVRFRQYVHEESPTIAQFAKWVRGNLGVVHWIATGTGEQIADQLESWFRAGAADGFNLLVPLLPKGLDDFVDQVVPELQRRGLFRREYEGRTLRDHLGLERPAGRRSGAGPRPHELHAEA